MLRDIYADPPLPGYDQEIKPPLIPYRQHLPESAIGETEQGE